MKITNILIVIFLLNVNINAQNLSGIPAAFADIGYGSRPVAMGSAFVGLANDVNSIVWNPAGLSSLEAKDFSLSFTRQINLINYYFMALGMPIEKGISGAGFALIYNGDDALKELTLNFGYSNKFGPLFTGINIKYRYASFGNNTLKAEDYVIFDDDEVTAGINNQVRGSANGFGFDIGVLYPINSIMTAGAVIRDAYSPVFWNSSNDNPINKPKGSYSETIPVEAVLGVSVKPIEELIFDVDYLPALYDDAISKFRFGGEAMFFKMVFLRAGYQQFINSRDDEKFSAGIGLYLNNFKDFSLKLDFTFVNEELANSQRFSLSIGF